MEVNIVLVILGAFVIAAALGFASTKMKSAAKKASEDDAAKKILEEKINALKQENFSLKEENQRKSRSLEEARDFAKKRLRKDAQKQDSDSSVGEAVAGSESDKLKRNLMAMENQIRSMKESEENKLASLKSSIEESHSKELNSLNAKIKELESKLEQVKLDATKRRQGLSKQLPNPINLTEVPTEVVSELSRLLRKNEQHEKMHGILQGKHQLAQERYQELQRRYFAVCRELALVALPQEETTDDEARRLAEKVVESSDNREKGLENQSPESPSEILAQEPSN